MDTNNKQLSQVKGLISHAFRRFCCRNVRFLPPGCKLVVHPLVAMSSGTPFLRNIDLGRASTRKGRPGYLIKLPRAGQQLEAVKLIASANKSALGRMDPSSWQDVEDVPRELWQNAAKDDTIHCPFEPSPASGGELYFRLVAVGVPEEGRQVLYRSEVREYKGTKADASAGAFAEPADDAPPAEPVHPPPSKKQKVSVRGGLGSRGGLGRGGGRGRGHPASAATSSAAPMEEGLDEEEDVPLSERFEQKPQAPPPPLQQQKGNWEWKRRSTWNEYLPTDQDTLESAYQAKRSGPVEVNGGLHHIIFAFKADGSISALQQIGRNPDGSDDTTRQREVRRVEGNWEWKRRSTWNEYLPTDQDTLESAYQAKRSGPVEVNGGLHHIIFAFKADGSISALQQIGRNPDGSDDTTRQREVRRVEITAQSPVKRGLSDVKRPAPEGLDRPVFEGLAAQPSQQTKPDAEAMDLASSSGGDSTLGGVQVSLVPDDEGDAGAAQKMRAPKRPTPAKTCAAALAPCSLEPHLSPEPLPRGAAGTGLTSTRRSRPACLRARVQRRSRRK